MDTLKDTVRRVVTEYAGEMLNGYSSVTSNADGTVLTVVDFFRIKQERFVDVGVIVRIVGEQVLIERDQNDKLVVDALIQAGIPRSQIVLAYAGEPVP